MKSDILAGSFLVVPIQRLASLELSSTDLVQGKAYKIEALEAILSGSKPLARPNYILKWWHEV